MAAAAHARLAFVETFYTGALFQVERFLLSLFARRPSDNQQARELAQGERTDFAAWTVEARTPDELLLRDYTGRTRSWLMVAEAREAGRTRLYFGSAVVPKPAHAGAEPSLGPLFRGLLGFHKLYSRALLWSAARSLRGRRRLP